MTSRNDYARLAKITRTAMDVAQGKMQKLLAQETAVRAQLEALQSSRQVWAPEGSSARSASADVKWQIWVDQRREELNFDLARLFVKKDLARAQLKRAFGKDQTVKALLKKQQLDRLAELRRHVS